MRPRVKKGFQDIRKLVKDEDFIVERERISICYKSMVWYKDSYVSKLDYEISKDIISKYF